MPYSQPVPVLELVGLVELGLPILLQLGLALWGSGPESHLTRMVFRVRVRVRVKVLGLWLELGLGLAVYGNEGRPEIQRVCPGTKQIQGSHQAVPA